MMLPLEQQLKRLRYLREQCKLARKKLKTAENKLKMYKAGQLVTIGDSLCRIEHISNPQHPCDGCNFQGPESLECDFCYTKLDWGLRLKLVTKLRKKPQ